MTEPKQSFTEEGEALSSREVFRQSFVEVIEKWKGFWMNQKQNDEADYQNYLHRALGVDANMKYHLAGLLADHADSALVAERARNLETLATLSDDYVFEIKKLESENAALKAELEELRKNKALFMKYAAKYTGDA
jgi:hypothetical protein